MSALPRVHCAHRPDVTMASGAELLEAGDRFLVDLANELFPVDLAGLEADFAAGREFEVRVTVAPYAKRKIALFSGGERVKPCATKTGQLNVLSTA